MRILEIIGNKGNLEVGGVVRSVDLSLVGQVSIGQYVIVHAGFAISTLQEDEAQKTLDLFNEIKESTLDESDIHER